MLHVTIRREIAGQVGIHLVLTKAFRAPWPSA